MAQFGVVWEARWAGLPVAAVPVRALQPGWIWVCRRCCWRAGFVVQPNGCWGFPAVGELGGCCRAQRHLSPITSLCATGFPCMLSPCLVPLVWLKRSQGSTCHYLGQAYSLNGIQSIVSCGFVFVSRRLVPEFGRELLLDVPSKLPIVNISMRREFYFRLKLMHQN